MTPVIPGLGSPEADGGLEGYTVNCPGGERVPDRDLGGGVGEVLNSGRQKRELGL